MNATKHAPMTDQEWAAFKVAKVVDAAADTWNSPMVQAVVTRMSEDERQAAKMVAAVFTAVVRRADDQGAFTCVKA